MIKYILFDLDGTILDFNMGERDAFIKTINKYSDYKLKDKDILKFSEINEYYFNKYKNGFMDRKTFHFNRFNDVSKYLNINIDPVLANSYYVEELKYEAQKYNDVDDIIDYLLNKYDLFIASNGMNEVQIKRIELAGLDKYFKKYYISENIGFNKPDVGFFDFIFNDLSDSDKSHYIIIGDRLDSDILGGINTGIKTIYVNRSNIDGEIKPDFEIKTLDEIKNIL